MTCPICKVPSTGTKPCPGYCEGVEDGREHEWQESETDHTRCARCGVPHKLSALRDFPHCPKMGAAERAILERDIAEVERALPGLRYDLRHDGRRRRVQVADCEAWLARARAALGGGQ